MPTSQPEPARVRTRYDAIAKRYDTVARFTMSHRIDAVRQLDLRDGTQILDLACGTGINFERIINANTNGFLLGLDYSLAMLEQARERLKSHNWANVAVCLADAAQLPFTDAAFDRILCTYALKVIPTYQRALDEVQRVLKRDGTFVVMDAKLGDGLTRFLNPLIRWMARGFLYDIGRPLISEIAQRFHKMETAEYDFGHTYVTVARKE